MESLINSWLGADATIYHKDLMDVKMADARRVMMVVVGTNMYKTGWYEWSGQGPFLDERGMQYTLGQQITVVVSWPPLPENIKTMPQAMRAAIYGSLNAFYLSALTHNPSSFYGQILPFLASEIQALFGQTRPVTPFFRGFLRTFK